MQIRGDEVFHHNYGPHGSFERPSWYATGYYMSTSICGCTGVSSPEWREKARHSLNHRPWSTTQRLELSTLWGQYWTSNQHRSYYRMKYDTGWYGFGTSHLSFLDPCNSSCTSLVPRLITWLEFGKDGWGPGSILEAYHASYSISASSSLKPPSE